MIVKRFFVFAFVFSFLPPVFAGWEKLENHLRQTLELPPGATFLIGEPSDSAIPGLKVLPVSILREGNKIGTKSILVTEDQGYYVVGELYDASIDLNAQRLSKISLEGAYVRGNPKAKVLIVEYTDLQCPFCRKSHEFFESRDFWQKYGKKVRLISKNFPLGMHPWAEPAAVASLCAGEQKSNAYWEMRDNFFSNQAEITQATVREKALEFAQKAKLKKDVFQACFDSKAPIERMRSEMREAGSLGISATPTIVINGRIFRGFPGPEAILQAIESEIK